MILKANWKYNLCWLILMVAGFYLMNTLILVGVINSFLENMMVTIGTVSYTHLTLPTTERV